MTTQRYDGQRDRMSEIIPKLPRRHRTAFAVACAQRVIPMAEWYFGTGQHAGLRKAIDVCWRYAMGESVRQHELKACEKLCNKLCDELDDDDMNASSEHYAVSSLLFAVQSTLDPDPGHVLQAYEDAGQAAHANDDPPHQDAHIQEEVDWQWLALEVARATPEPTREMFGHLPCDPDWCKGYRERNGMD